MNKTQQKAWQFKPSLETTDDPLLECLALLCKIHERPTSHQALTAGLPLVGNKLTPELFKRAAARVGLSARILKRDLNAIKTEELPAVLFLENAQACILTKTEGNQFAEIIQPTTGEGHTKVPFATLEKDYIGYAIFVKPLYHFGEEGAEAATKPRTAKHWFWGIMFKAMPAYSEVLIASFLINLFTIASPLFIMNVYDRVVPNNAIETLWVLAIGVIIVFAFDFVIRTLRTFFIESVGKKIDQQITKQTFSQIMDLQMGSRPTTTGSLVNSVQAFDFFREFITSATISLLVDLPFVLLFILVIAMLGGTVALVPLIIIPIVLAVSFLVQMSFQQLIEKSHQLTAEKQALLIESISGIETVKCMRAEGIMQRRWEGTMNMLAKLGIKIRSLASLGVNASIYAQHMSIIGVVIVGVYRISKGNMTMGALVACVILTGRALAPVSQLAVLLTRYKQAKNSLNSLNKIMELPVERPAGKQFLHRPELKGSIEFKDVNFTYPNQAIASIHDTSFRITPGEHVGIIGSTGSGKSTIMKLILKLYTAESGNILIDGTEIAQIDPAELRYHIGYIPQDVILFNGSLRNNIVIGAPHADDTAVLTAIKLSGADTFISKHPDGLDLKIYERGQNLSGGQKQTIAIARALLQNPPILLFDEPCNGMDENATMRFIERLRMITTNKTIILVTHKQSLLGLVNRLLVVDSGHVVVDGPKQQILDQLTKPKQSKKTPTQNKVKPNEKKPKQNDKKPKQSQKKVKANENKA